ncbi:MAG: succinate dehydrogenase / fumarate reductase, cytochrome b subunit [Thermodesulfobacteriota bacterium]|nr:succinate dehydrogenase / fumarate reductase, cytochrome b subunit [Thermodesulfobacteriota bacterium]
MSSFIKTLFSSIARKQMMALTGLSFCAFLAIHLFGNLTIYGGKTRFNAYSDHLHSLGVLINVAEIGLLLLALIHILLATLLYVENWQARPVRYVMKTNAGGRTLSSTLMPYTGLYLLVFVIIHLLTFHFVDRGNQGIFQIVANVFSKPGYVIFYAFSMIVAAFHVKHGFWSAFQTLGGNHPKYMPLIRAVSLIFSLCVAAGFGFIPIFVMAST